MIPHKIEISARTIIFTVVFLLLLKVLWIIRELIFALFFAFIFMSALKPAVNFSEKHKVPRFLSVLVVSILVLLGFIGLATFIIPPLVSETFTFFKNLPFLIEEIFPSVASYIDTTSFTEFLPDITQNFIKVISGFFSNFVFIISVLFFTFYFLLEEKFLSKFLDKFVSQKTSSRIVAIFGKIEKRMSAWLWGELILILVIGSMSYIGLTLLQIRYATALAIIAGLLEVVPIIGPLISALPAFFVASSTSWFMGLSVVALYFLIQQLENNLIVPFVMRRTSGIHPITTLIALTIGGKLGGAVGIILSVPIALVVETLFIELYTEKGSAKEAPS